MVKIHPPFSLPVSVQLYTVANGGCVFRSDIFPLAAYAHWPRASSAFRAVREQKLRIRAYVDRYGTRDTIAVTNAKQ